jgi:hypothetical protein
MTGGSQTGGCQLTMSGACACWNELVEVNHEQASKIIEHFRSRWGTYGEPLDS